MSQHQPNIRKSTDDELFRLLVENVHDYAIFLVDPQGLVRSWNPGAERLLGYSEAEIIGRHIAIFFTPEDIGRGVPKQQLTNALETGRDDDARLHVRKDGSIFWSAGSITPLWDEGRNLRGFAQIMRDRTAEKRGEDALKDALAYSHGVVDTVREPMLVLGADLRVKTANRSFFQTFRVSLEETENRLIYDLGDGQWHIPRLRTLLEEILPRDRSFDGFEVEHEFGNIGRKVFLLNARRLLQEGSRTELILLAIENVTERRRAEEERREIECDFTSLVKNVKDYAIFAMGLDGCVTNWNVAAEHILGYSESEIIGQPFSVIFTPEDILEGVPASELRIAAETGRAENLRWHLRHGGARFWAVGIVTSMHDVGGRLTGFSKILRDMTEQKLAEERLQRARDNAETQVCERTSELRKAYDALRKEFENRSRAEGTVKLRDRAIESVSQGIIISDPSQTDNPIVYASPGVQRLTGYSNEEMVGHNCRYLQGKDTDPLAVARIRQAVRLGQACHVELLNYRKDGTPFWNEFSLTPILDDDGRLTHFVGVQTDVTQRYLLEEQFRQAQKMEAFGQLAAGVAHDFNNILTVISGYSEVLLATLKPNDLNRGPLQEIHKAGERAGLLTRQLLAFSRKQVIQPVVMDLNDLVAGTQKMLERLIGEDVILTSKLAPDLDRVKADPGQMEQIVLNLVVNARDAMPQGGKTTIETANVDLDEMFGQSHAEVVPGRYVLLAISDTGTGMTEEVKRRVFEPFFTTKEPGKGTGLGLATVFGIVKQNGGHLGVYSELGHGTTFKVYLPSVENADATSRVVEKRSFELNGTETILIVEDDKAVRAMTVSALRLSGYCILEAEGGDEAICLCERHTGTIHLLVSDVVMPRIGGRKLAERLMTMHPEMRVLFVSGYTDDAVVRHGVLEAEVAFLQKPFSIDALRRKVRSVLSDAKK